MEENTTCDRYEELCSALEDLQLEFDYAARLVPFLRLRLESRASGQGVES